MAKGLDPCAYAGTRVEVAQDVFQSTMANYSFPWERWEQLSAAAEYDSFKLAKLCGVTVRKLQRIFKKDLGRSPQEMLNAQRLDVARQLLRGGKSVKEVALQMGYKHPNNFCRYFKTEMRTTASQFALS